MKPHYLIFDNFWEYTGSEMQMQMVNFLKNISIMGGLSLVAAYDSAALIADRATIGDTESVASPLRRAMAG